MIALGDDALWMSLNRLLSLVRVRLCLGQHSGAICDVDVLCRSTLGWDKQSDLPKIWQTVCMSAAKISTTLGQVVLSWHVLLACEGWLYILHAQETFRMGLLLGQWSFPCLKWAICQI